MVETLASDGVGNHGGDTAVAGGGACTRPIPGGNRTFGIAHEAVKHAVVRNAAQSKVPLCER